jgi:hypothetical protein
MDAQLQLFAHDYFLKKNSLKLLSVLFKPNSKYKAMADWS